MRITIQNIGNIKFADLELKKANVIIGPQSLGKSTVLKICSYCCWVEKRIQLSQNPEAFGNGKQFISRLVDFHKLGGYFRHDSYIRYESDTMVFHYSYGENAFEFCWKPGHWNYKMPKISYIPSERNIVGSIPNWFDVNLPNNNIRNFMSDWETSRKSLGDVPILNLNLSYHYDKSSNQDKIRLGNNGYLEFTNSSSGIQSIVPMFVVLNYINETVKRNKSLNDFIDEMGDEWQVGNSNVKDNIARKALRDKIYDETIGKGLNRTDYIKCLYHYMVPQLVRIFLEEPENSLFPPTQDRFINWLLGEVAEIPGSTVFVATHSPYVLDTFLEGKDDYGMFVVYPDVDGLSLVKGLSKDNQLQICDYGVDSFFNLQNLVSD